MSNNNKNKSTNQDQIKLQLKNLFKLKRDPHWYTECVKWTEKTEEYIKKGKSEDEAGLLSAKEVWGSDCQTTTLLTESVRTDSVASEVKSRSDSIINILEAIRKK